MAGRSYQQARGRRFAGLNEREWTGSFFFTQLADTQLGLLHAQRDPCTWEEERAMLETAIDHVNALHPRFMVICGDLTNAMPNGSQGNPDLLKLQVAALKQSLARVHPDIPLVSHSFLLFFL